MLVTFVLGSVHAFSVFLAPLELQLELPRSQISLIYSFALVAITLSVTLGYRVYGRLSSWWMVALACVLAALGLWIAAAAVNWWMLFAGYSLAFGISNGIGYGYCLQLVGRAIPERRGMVMGAVTAAYAVGSIVFAKVIAWRMDVDSVDSAFATMALIVLVAGSAAAGMLFKVRTSYGESTDGVGNDRNVTRTRVLQFWLAYLSSVFAGLMAIGHAAAIALARGADSDLATATAMTVGIGSALGGFVAGWLVDRWSLVGFLVGLPLMSTAALIGTALTGDAQLTLLLLGFVGFAYGAIIAIYPVAIANEFGQQGPRVYGRVFIAWGFAGLVGPWSAGVIYDWQTSYQAAMLMAAAVALLSAVCAGAFRLGKPA